MSLQTVVKGQCLGWYSFLQYGCISIHTFVYIKSLHTYHCFQLCVLLWNIGTFDVRRSTRGSTWDLALFASWSNGTLEQMSPTSTQICRCPRFFFCWEGKVIEKEQLPSDDFVKNKWTWIFDYFISGALKPWNHMPCFFHLFRMNPHFPTSSFHRWKVGTDAIGTFGAIQTVILVMATFAIQVVLRIRMGVNKWDAEHPRRYTFKIWSWSTRTPAWQQAMQGVIVMQTNELAMRNQEVSHSNQLFPLIFLILKPFSGLSGKSRHSMEITRAQWGPSFFFKGWSLGLGATHLVRATGST